MEKKWELEKLNDFDERKKKKDLLDRESRDV